MTLAKYARTQAELETIAHAEYKRKLLSDDIAAAARNYTSSTPFGRALLKGSAQGPEGKAVPTLELLANLIAVKLAKDVARRGPKLAASLLLQAADQIRRAVEKCPSYAGTTENPLDLIAVITMKAYVDGIATNAGGRWPAAGTVLQRIGEAIDLQRLDALCVCTDPEAYRKQQQRWTRGIQGISNKATNISLGQREILSAVDLTRSELVWPASDRLAVGAWLNDLVLEHLQLVEAVTQPPRKPKQKGLTVIRPLPALLEQYPAFLERLAVGQLTGYPLIEPPLPWQQQEGPGRYNHTGGYHGAAARSSKALVRGRFGENSTELSPLAIELLNTLGAVAFKADHDSCRSFDWAVVNHSQGVDDLANWPMETFYSLQQERASMMAHIAETGLHPSGFLRGSEEHTAWKHSQRDRYEEAIAAERRFIRTRAALLASKTIREFKEVWFSWSSDYRGRIYPQQTLLSPQGPSVEKVLLRFSQGEHLSPEGETEVLAAIGVAFKGNRLSLADRAAWGKANLKELLDATAGGEPADVKMLSSQFGAKNPWDALQLLRAAERTFRRGQPWDVPIGIDASQSGTQLLGGLLRDYSTLVATNVLVGHLGPDKGPEDGYLHVQNAARFILSAKPAALLSATSAGFVERLEKVDPAVRFWVARLVEHSNARRAMKLTSMPMVYGSAHQSTAQGLSNWIHAQGIDLVAELGSWQAQQAVVNGLTTVLREAVRLTFPKAMTALGWLKRLAQLSLKQQLEAGVALPEMRWTLSDGTVIAYHESELETKRIHTLQMGTVKVPVGAGLETDVAKTVAAFAPGFIHSLDGLLLRVALQGWSKPVITIHDSIKVLPGDIPALKGRIREGFIEVCSRNPLEGLAAQMGVSMEQLPLLEMGKADLEKVRLSRYMFH